MMRAAARGRCRAAAWCCWRLLLAVLLAAPWFANDYLLTVLILILYFAYTGQAWNIMMGFAGQLSLGHAIYVGLGAYAAAALYVHFGVGAVDRAAGRDRWSRWRAARSSASSRSASASPASISRSSPSRSPSSRASASIISAGSAARPASSCRSRKYTPQRSVEPARQPDDVLLRDAGADRRGVRALPRAAAQPHRLLLAGDPRGRAGARARSASTRSATR